MLTNGWLKRTDLETPVNERTALDVDACCPQLMPNFGNQIVFQDIQRSFLEHGWIKHYWAEITPISTPPTLNQQLTQLKVAPEVAR